jgi:hypothetical protein
MIACQLVGKPSMDFTRVLQAAVGILVLEGRISYRRLKTEFDLSDAQLKAIKFEIAKVRQLAVNFQEVVHSILAREAEVGRHQ